jgi:hypothetical protein
VLPLTLHKVWFGAMILGGAAVGLAAERRPFGSDVLAHPLALFFLLVALALLSLRVARRRPVTDLLSERVLVSGCLAALAAFLVGNWIDAHLFGWRG